MAEIPFSKPENFPVDCEIVNGSYMSWLSHDYNGVYIKPKIQPQIGNKCAYYSFCPSVETRSKALWKDHDCFDERQNFSVDVQWLISNAQEDAETKAKNPDLIVERLKTNSRSRVKCAQDKQVYPFLVPSCEIIPMSLPQERLKYKAVERVNAAIEDFGPVIGAFAVTQDYKDVKKENRIYTGDGPKIMKEDGKELMHAVCLVGMLQVKLKGVQHGKRYPAYEYLDSGRMPSEGNTHRNRVLLASALKAVYIPHAHFVPDNHLRIKVDGEGDDQVEEKMTF